jgi:hypothetical protein
MSSKIPSPLPLILGLVALLLFAPALWIMEANRAWAPTLQVAIPALLLGAVSVWAGMAILKSKPSGGRYGWAMTGSLCGGFSLVFWICMVPMLLLVALPARDLDPEDPELEQARKQIRLWVRHVKSFHGEYGRLPVKLEELVDKGYAPDILLYDPRQKRRDAPSYRLTVDQFPPVENWSVVPLLEGRIPDRQGRRLLAYPDGSTGLTESLVIQDSAGDR